MFCGFIVLFDRVYTHIGFESDTFWHLFWLILSISAGNKILNFIENQINRNLVHGKLHELKTWGKYFVEVKNGDKKFELRKNDRDFKIGDYLLLREYNPNTEEYTGRELIKRIDYILEGGDFGLKEGYVILSIS